MTRRARIAIDAARMAEAMRVLRGLAGGERPPLSRPIRYAQLSRGDDHRGSRLRHSDGTERRRAGRPGASRPGADSPRRGRPDVEDADTTDVDEPTEEEVGL